MSSLCCVSGCASGSRYDTEKALFHRFPVDKQLRKAWIKFAETLDHSSRYSEVATQDNGTYAAMDTSTVSRTRSSADYDCPLQSPTDIIAACHCRIQELEEKLAVQCRSAGNEILPGSVFR